MEPYTIFPDDPITGSGPIARIFLGMRIQSFVHACRYVHEIPYGYNSNRDDLMILFKENKGSCTTKHAVIATLATEVGIAVNKYIGIYPMTETIVTGAQAILDRHNLPYVPMVHCFLVYGDHRVDLSQGNRNGKNGPIDEFLHMEKVAAAISAKDEYLLYRRALEKEILVGGDLQGVALKTILKAREDGLTLLKANIGDA